MPTPSLLIVPSRWKAGSPGKLYSQIPTNGNGDFNVTGVVTGGTSIGTRVNNIGYIEPITTSGTPRLDYYTSGGTAGCPALLVEAGGTNLVVQSQNWLASGWRDDATANVTTVSATTGTLDPLGTNTANAISPTSGSTTHLKVGSDGAISFTSGTIYTASAFFKQGAGNAGRYVQIVWPTTRFAANTFANFDLELGTVALVTGSTVTAGIENYGNGWYRCRCTNTCISTGTGANGISIALIETSGATRLPTFTGTTTDVLYGWGAQTETGSIATSYIPTTTTAVTRSADVISATGAVSGSIGQTEGTIYVEVDVRNAISRVASILQLRQDGNNQITLGITTAFGGTNTIAARAQQAGSFVVGFFQSNNATGIYKIAFAYKSTDCKLYINGTDSGVTISLNNAFTAFSFNEIQLGMSNSLNQFNDRIRAAALYTTRLTNADLMLLTMPGNNTYLPQAIWDNYLSRPGNSEVPDCLYTRHADLLDV